eukprot:64438_1
MHMNECVSNRSISATYQLWKSTRINPKHLSNIHLYVPRKDKMGTYPISLQPYQYLSKLGEYNISVDSLNIPTSCPHFQNSQANQTAKILFNIIKSQTYPLAKIQSSSNKNQNLHNKLDWIMNQLGYNDMQTTMKYLHVADEVSTNTTNSDTIHTNSRKRNRETLDDRNTNYGTCLKRQRVIECTCGAVVQEINENKPTKKLLWKLKVCTLQSQHLKPHKLSVKGPKWLLIDRIYEHYKIAHHNEI